MTWDELRALRDGGQRPLRLVVTTEWRRASALAAEGAMVIVHERGKSMPVELLEGLDVELRLDSCAQSTAVARLIKSRSVVPTSVRTMCPCDGSLALMWPIDCRAKIEMDAAWEMLCNRAA